MYMCQEFLHLATGTACDRTGRIQSRNWSVQGEGKYIRCSFFRNLKKIDQFWWSLKQLEITRKRRGTLIFNIWLISLLINNQYNESKRLFPLEANACASSTQIIECLECSTEASFVKDSEFEQTLNRTVQSLSQVNGVRLFYRISVYTHTILQT